MFLRVDKLQIELPAPKKQDPNAAAALQELLGGKYGEMSTLGNYMFQSFNFRSKSKLRPFYSLVAAITAEELGHVELVSNGVAMLANGPDSEANETGGADISGAPFEEMKNAALPAGFLSHAGGAVPINSNGLSWNKDFVTTTGQRRLRPAAQLPPRMRRPAAQAPRLRDACRTRPGARCAATCWSAAASTPMPTPWRIKKITGADITKILPTPNIPTDKIPESQKYLEEGSHRRLYRFSPNDYAEMAGIWGNGEQALPTDPPGELEVVDGMPEGGKIHDLTGMASAFTPDYAPEEMFEVASKLYKMSR